MFITMFDLFNEVFPETFLGTIRLAIGLTSHTIPFLKFAAFILVLKILIFLKIILSGFVWFCRTAPQIWGRISNSGVLSYVG
jgi:hypothetical protein